MGTDSLGSTVGTDGTDTTGGAGAEESGASTSGDALCEAGGDWNLSRGGGGGTQDDGAEDTGFGMGDDMPLTIFEVQQGAAVPGDRVVISNVVVTSPVSLGEEIGGREFFVQELVGGPYSGLRVQTGWREIETLVEPGMTIDVSGSIAQNGDFVMLRVSDVEDVIEVGTGQLPTPPIVTASELSTDDDAARAYEGVVVRVVDGTVTDTEPCIGEFTLDDTVRVDDRFVPDALQTPAAGAVIAEVDGVVVFANDEYELAPTIPFN